MQSDPDRDLVLGLGSPDRDERRRALAQVYERHAESLVNVAWRVSGDWSTAQDVVHDVFLTLEARIKTFRGESTLVSWLYRITTNRAIDLKRYARRRPAAGLGALADDALEDARAPGQPLPEPPEPVETDGEAIAVRDALDRLSPKLRAIAVLRYVEGLSYDQLAEVLDCSLGTVKSRLNRAHAALARALGLPPPG